jgi:peroxiredoxin
MPLFKKSTPTDAAPKKKKARWKRWTIEILVILAIYFGIKTWQQHGMVSGEAPDIMMMSTQNELVSLDTYRDKPVLIHFWATWCRICELEQDWITDIAKDWPVITIAFDSGSEEQIKRYIERHGLEDWTVIIDKDGSLAEHYGVTAVPSTYVVDSQGNIRFREMGLTTAWGWRARLWFTDKIDG